jgi:hypothetical protein
MESRGDSRFRDFTAPPPPYWPFTKSLLQNHSIVVVLSGILFLLCNQRPLSAFSFRSKFRRFAAISWPEMSGRNRNASFDESDVVFEGSRSRRDEERSLSAVTEVSPSCFAPATAERSRLVALSSIWNDLIIRSERRGRAGPVLKLGPFSVGDLFRRNLTPFALFLHDTALHCIQNDVEFIVSWFGPSGLHQ